MIIYIVWRNIYEDCEHRQEIIGIYTTRAEAQKCAAHDVYSHIQTEIVDETFEMSHLN